MDDHKMYYEKLIELTKVISHCKELEEVALTTAQGVKTAFNVKGCSIFLLQKDREVTV